MTKLKTIRLLSFHGGLHIAFVFGLEFRFKHRLMIQVIMSSELGCLRLYEIWLTELMMIARMDILYLRFTSNVDVVQILILFLIICTTFADSLSVIRMLRAATSRCMK